MAKKKTVKKDEVEVLTAKKCCSKAKKSPKKATEKKTTKTGK